ncbi:MAG: tRNA1(Val) (adenine(37)-N6)-methyltransferase [Candidatus Omnitrophota bacterium]
MLSDLDNSAITQDYFYKKKVIVYQRKKGYRFSVDAPILADFLPSLPTQQALEIGIGSGIIALLALHKKKFSSIYGVEIHPGLSQLAKLNAEKNGFSQNLLVINADFNEIHREFKGIRLIFSNPPFFETHRGKLSPNPEIRDAKTETRLTLHQLLTHAYAILGKKSSLCLVLPYSRFDEVMKLAPQIGYAVARLRYILSFPDGKPERFLVQLTNYDVAQLTMEPLIIFLEKGVYTPEMTNILTG